MYVSQLRVTGLYTYLSVIMMLCGNEIRHIWKECSDPRNDERIQVQTKPQSDEPKCFDVRSSPVDVTGQIIWV